VFALSTTRVPVSTPRRTSSLVLKKVRSLYLAQLDLVLMVVLGFNMGWDLASFVTIYSHVLFVRQYHAVLHVLADTWLVSPRVTC